MPQRSCAAWSRLHNLTKLKKQNSKNDNNNNYGKFSHHILRARHLNLFFHKQKFLMNLTRWTQIMFPSCQLKMMVTLRALVWRSWTVAVILTSVKRVNWQGSAEYSVTHKKRHWQKKRQGGTSGDLTLGILRPLHTVGNTFKMILMLRANLPLMSSYNKKSLRNLP